MGVAEGPDADVWFTEFHGNKVGSMLQDGTGFGDRPPDARKWSNGHRRGGDGRLWFTEFTGNRSGGSLAPGVISEFPLPSPDRGPWGIARGSDGGLWFTERSANRLGRLSTTGLLNEFTIPEETVSWPGSRREIWIGGCGLRRQAEIASARSPAIASVIVGAGQIGTVGNQIRLQTPKATLRAFGSAYWEAPLVCGLCPGLGLSGLPANGSETTTIDSIPGTVYLDPFSVGVDPPTVVARVSNRARPSQAMELPVIRMSTLESLDPSTLPFPSAIRSAEGHSNLLLAEVGGSRDIATRIEAFSAGAKIWDRSNFSWGACDSIFFRSTP